MVDIEFSEDDSGNQLLMIPLCTELTVKIIVSLLKLHQLINAERHELTTQEKL